MDEKIKKILEYTPYNSYQDLFYAVQSNKATIKLSNSACRQISQTQKPLYSNLGLFLGFIPSAIVTIFLAITYAKYLLLLLLLIELAFPHIIYMLQNFNFKPGFIAALVIICEIFLFDLPISIFILVVSFLFSSIAVTLWKNQLYKISMNTLKYNQDAFEWAFNSHNLIIEDCYGNIYDKFRQNELEKVSYERLLNIITIATGLEDVNSAISMYSNWYLKNGIDIPNELYSDVSNLSENDKFENLLKILEIGIGVKGINSVTKEMVDFYKSKGIVFPNDV